MNHFDEIDPIREIIQRARNRFLTIRPGGFEFEKGHPPVPQIEARIPSFGGARTLYRNKKPHCRSLDGIKPIKSLSDENLSCAQCKLRSQCTPQVLLNLIAGNNPYRLLLANTSAKQFLIYINELQNRSLALENHVHLIRVINRKSWGELCFSTLRSATKD
jgi:hypothetical protein